MRPTKIFGVYEEGRKILTKNFTPGQRVYDEDIFTENGVEFREWNPNKSKLGAYIKQGVRDIFIREGDVVLYLGIANGTTASHVSDIIGKEGMVFGVEFAYRPLLHLMHIAQERKNLAPLFGDANQPDNYRELIPKEVDVLFQDVAQRDQAGIFIKNMQFVKKGGFGMLAVKARSVAVNRRPKDVFKEVRKAIEEKFTIVDMKTLEPYEKDHCMIIVKKN